MMVEVEVSWMEVLTAPSTCSLQSEKRKSRFLIFFMYQCSPTVLALTLGVTFSGDEFLPWTLAELLQIGLGHLLAPLRSQAGQISRKSGVNLFDIIQYFLHFHLVSPENFMCDKERTSNCNI